MTEPINFSKTQRIVFLIDLHPLLKFHNRNPNPNPNPYLTTILASAKRFLTFAPLSNSLFAFKLFFSCLSPLRSASEVHRLLPNPVLTTLSFNSNCQTLTSLTTILDTLSRSQISDQLSDSRARATQTASSLIRLVHDYAWESEPDNLLRGKGNGDSQMIRSNLILLFSPICRSNHDFSEYVEMEGNAELLNDLDGIFLRFYNVFGGVNDVFASKDIHFSWVDVKCELQGDEEEVKTNECKALIMSGIRNLGWGFCSTDSIILGSALIPFGLIYPKIGTSFNFLNLEGLCKRSGVQLNLRILDVNGKPLECNCCDLELLNLKALPEQGSDDMLSSLVLRDSQEEMSDQYITLDNQIPGGVTKLCIKAVWRFNEGDKIEKCSSDIILVREYLGEPKKPKKKHHDDFLAEKILCLLSRESNEPDNCNPIPIWQILLSFLYQEGYWAVVSLSNSNELVALGILKPFTVHCALLSIINSDCSGVHECSLSGLDKINSEIHEICVDAGNLNALNSSRSETSTSANCEPSSIGKKKNKRKHLTQDLTWSSFCKAASEYCEFDLAAAFFARYFDHKKLKFLKCWMKQIIKYSPNCLRILHKSKYNGEASILPSFPLDPSEVQDGAMFATSSETPEAFLNSLPQRIQQGLESGMDLATLAERLVKSSIHSCQACANGENMESQNPVPKGDDSRKSIGLKIIKLLLRNPKEMKHLSRFDEPFSKLLDPSPISERIVREYELQVLLRMEILRSNILDSMEEPIKQKILKQICSFLEIIQYLIDGGIHGNVSLYEYVQRTIKARYYDDLEDTVNNIYGQMDLLPFGDEDEAQAFLLFNSEDSNQSWRDTKEKPERADMKEIHLSVSVGDDPDQPVDKVDEGLKGARTDEHALKLSEAHERRERALRFASFIRGKPDLQRVWAPKQPKAVKGRSDSLHKDSKRKDRQGPSYSVVHETPLTERKRPYSSENSEDIDNCSNSVSKALFQDD